MNIVIVEDEIRIREGILRLVEKINDDYHVVATAENGLEGYNCIKELKPDVVITDIMMAEMSGMEMLSKLKEEGIMPSAIVISAYSEFSYAQTAIRLGVKEYLIKPVTINEMKKALANVEAELSEQDYVSEALGSLNNIFLGVINGMVDAGEKLDIYLNNKYGIKNETGFMEMTIYLGYYYEESVSKVKKTIEKILTESGADYLVLELPTDMSLLAIMYNYESEDFIERHIQEKIRQNSVSLHRVCMGIARTEGIRNIKSSYDVINSYLDWNMIFGDDVLIMYPKVTKIFAEKDVYPLDIENKMKAAVYSKNKKAALTEVKNFEEHYFNGKLYEPKNVKEAYCRFIWSALETCKDINENEPAQITQKQLIERIDRAKSSGEMKDILEMMFEGMIKEKVEDDNVGLTVKKTIKMIHEYYKDGITLDEIAGRLNITPEYLSAQFQKEMGLNFSAYIRNYRIGKAKQLLVSGNMKVYEVAEEVGYQDSKYFSRVFRQVTGQKPDEYRKNKR